MIIVDGNNVRIPVSMGPNYNLDFENVNVTENSLKIGYTAYDRYGNLIHGNMDCSEDAYWEDFSDI